MEKIRSEVLSLKDNLYKKEWIVYSKAPFSSVEDVLQYLGRYTHRVAISDNRIIKVDNQKVVFKWRDYKDKNKEKVMSFVNVNIIKMLKSSNMKMHKYLIVELLSGSFLLN